MTLDIKLESQLNSFIHKFVDQGGISKLDI